MPNYPNGTLFPGYRGIAPRREKQDAIDVLRVPIIPRGQAKGLQLALNYLSFAVSATVAALFLRRQSEVILVFQPSPVTVGIPAIALKWLTGAPIVFWVQDLWPESLVATGTTRNRTVIGAVRRLVEAIYRRSAIIAVPSRAFEGPVRAIMPGSDIRYLPNPANPEPGAPTILQQPAGGVSLPDGFRIVFTGNFGVAQGLDTVIDAAHRTRHLPHVKWVFVGDGRVRERLRARIDAEGLSGTVAIIGPFPARDMPPLLAQADALLVTLRKDPLFSLTVPSKLQTYLAAGKPILAATDGETARLIADAGAGITCPAGDPDALADAAIRMSQLDDAVRRAMGAAGRACYTREFALDQIVARLEGWLTELRGSRTCAS